MRSQLVGDLIGKHLDPPQEQKLIESNEAAHIIKLCTDSFTATKPNIDFPKVTDHSKIVRLHSLEETDEIIYRISCFPSAFL